MTIIIIILHTTQHSLAPSTALSHAICRLTWKTLHVFRARGFVTSAGFAHGFVAGGQEDNAEEGEKEGNGGRDVPLGKDDAEVLGGPGEEHLREEN